MLIEINSFPIKTNIIQVYAPTADKSGVLIETFYEELTNVLNKLHKNDITSAMGDFSAKNGQGRCEEVVGPFGLGERNERGERLCIFSIEQQLAVTNTLCTLPPRRLYA